MAKEMDFYGVLQNHIAKSYGFQIYEGEKIKKVWKLKTSEGIKVLKKVRASYDRFLFTVEAMEHARHLGFRWIPKVIQTLDGNKGIHEEDGVWMVSEWINGREADYHDPLDLELTVKALADFHKAARGFTPTKAADPRILWGKWIENFQKRYKEMQTFQEMARAKAHQDAFDQKILHYTDYFLDWAIKSIRHLEQTAYVQISSESEKNKEFCHHDMANHNVLITEEQEVYLIDFDYCILDTPLHDLTSLMIRNIRYGNWDLEWAYFILDTYNQTKRIRGEQIGVIRAFMEFPQEFWQIGLQYYVEKQPWEEEVFHRRLDRILDDIPQREVFMKKFLV